MNVIVHSWATDIHFYDTWGDRFKFFFFSCEGIKYLQHFEFLSFIFIYSNNIIIRTFLLR
ncbi:hypothetical protein FC95_GL000045 [Lentilactobacillus kefiri DSM 20587 = JCM 5818]|uniref:Uncharacterized protein n=1 Tax=Lentilactobacillus kefiri DSM 20587 = JCM 5818 TaxID=1423764 RepID=A0A8E1RH59_LENKE|nr:hypothetical protein FD08_GL004421 [Lentilactobacillus parakefiri DSM 10551]KRM49909.1 hypothetical protein FC95_GL000045 [Lentilactobacillus kefiri DSM 20587 = JCM 5818]